MLLVYFSRVFNPPAPSSNADVNAHVAYGNLKHGLLGMVAVWLGMSQSPDFSQGGLGKSSTAHDTAHDDDNDGVDPPSAPG